MLMTIRILSAVVCVRRPEGVLCNGGFESIVSTFWFVIVTMTSVGYGDFSPGTEWCAQPSQRRSTAAFFVLAASRSFLKSCAVSLELARSEAAENAVVHERRSL